MNTTENFNFRERMWRGGVLAFFVFLFVVGFTRYNHYWGEQGKSTEWALYGILISFLIGFFWPAKAKQISDAFSSNMQNSLEAANAQKSISKWWILVVIIAVGLFIYIISKTS